MKKNKRYLVWDTKAGDWNLHRESGDVIEIKVLELSKKRIKIKYMISGFVEWVDNKQYKIAEEL